MGFKQVDLVPISVLGPTPITPVGKDVVEKIFQVTRADLASVLKVALPGDSTITGVTFFAGVSSDAAISASVTLVVVNNTGTVSTGSVDVKTNGATTAIVQMSSLPNIEAFPIMGDLRISAVYAETGAASTVGGPWKIVVRYVR